MGFYSFMDMQNIIMMTVMQNIRKYVQKCQKKYKAKKNIQCRVYDIVYDILVKTMISFHHVHQLDSILYDTTLASQLEGM
jgi:hypothetical protein